MIKILVVEDNQEKLRHVVTVLQEVSGCSIDSIDTAHDNIEAKTKLRAKKYDLLILDVALPERSDRIPSPEGGIALLKEVLDREHYNKPREVVGLTAFPEVREKVGPLFAEDLWDVILYDSSSEAWADQLKRKIRYIQLASKSETNSDYETDLCVLTALQDPELAALMKISWEWQSFEVPGDTMVYWRGCFSHEGHSRSVIAASAPRVGMTAAGVAATKMIHNFKPRFIAMTGIVAGVRGSCQIGDIIAADPVWDWGSGKRYVEGGSPAFAAAPHQLGLSSYVRGKISAMSTNSAIFDEIRRKWPGPKPNTVLTMHLGPVASGAAVLADGSFTESLKQQHRKIIGVEMEVYGLFGAADEAPLPPPKALALKSVCDFADAEKNDEYQSYAAYTSASALQILVEQYLF